MSKFVTCLSINCNDIDPMVGEGATGNGTYYKNIRYVFNFNHLWLSEVPKETGDQY